MATLKEFENSSYLGGGNAAYLEEQYENYLTDPNLVSEEWRRYFDSLKASGESTDVSHQSVIERFKKQAQATKRAVSAPAQAKQEAVDNLIDSYRRYGFMAAKLDPLGLKQGQDPRLTLSYHGLDQSDLTKSFLTRGVLAAQEGSLKQIFDSLQSYYSRYLTVEFDYVLDQNEYEWLQHYVEHQLHFSKLTADEKQLILKRLIDAEGLEQYLGKRYVGQKRFSLEGGESLIPMLDEMVLRLSENSVREVNIGMAHRGRLNVQMNVMGRYPNDLFDEFEGKRDFGMTTGDVKYHMGYSTDIKTPHGSVHLSLGFNPSHLEFINPVLMGSTRARQDREANGDKNYAGLILIHGDAAFIGQGVVMETLSMSQTRGYGIGGTIHIVLDNQVGFTTDRADDLRSTLYSSDAAKMIGAPVIHVNGDHPEEVIAAARMAARYRQKFKKDIVINLVCYRRHGHNESDEPSATQPLMYKVIRSLPTVAQQYGDRLVQENVLSEEGVAKIRQDYQQSLENNVPSIPLEQEGLSKKNAKIWQPYIDAHWTADYHSQIDLEELKALAKKLTTLPEGFELQRQVARMMDQRVQMANGELDVDWGFAENLAYATLLKDQKLVRISGEDVARGTFAHRHAIFFDNEHGEEYCPLQHVADNQAPFLLYNSLLSECGALGFEYGYASYNPESLVIWEAQFGDFVNGAQVIIDQFITSGWQKWNRLSGVTLLLPHGQEGMGPEHSSARLERFMQLAAQDNIQVCVPTTAAQIFHLLRRQALRAYRCPLVVMSPKSLLRHKLVGASLEELANGSFQTIIPEIDQQDVKKVKRVILCSGKVYYDLLEKRAEKKQDNVAILRIEQLYPFPYREFEKIMKQYSHVKDIVWCQEEPRNQGAWYTGRHRLMGVLNNKQTLNYVGRDTMAAPAPGYPALHKKQQQALVEEALAV